MARHVLRSVKALPESWGGLSAGMNVSMSVAAAAGLYDGDPRTTRVMVVDVEDGRVTIRHDHVYRDRIDHPEEERRASRLDDLHDQTVHSVFWPECQKPHCAHPEPARATLLEQASD